MSKPALLRLLVLGGLACACGGPASGPAVPPVPADAAGKPVRLPGEWVTEVPGFWAEAPRRAETDRSADQREQIERLHSIGYLQGYETAPPRSGVTVHDRRRAQQGLNLYVSGHAPEALLMGMDGAILHRWHHDFASIVWPGKLESPPGRGVPSGTEAWRRAHVFPDGGLLAIYDGFGLVKLDRESRLEWFYPGRAHHDLDVGSGGQVVVLTREARVIPELNPTTPILEDFIAILGEDGHLVRRISLIDSFEKSPFATLPYPNYRIGGDVFHTNTLTILDGTLADAHPAFRAGNFLISMRHNNTIAVVDPDAENVVWAMTGGWRTQHEPTLLGNGRMLIFDNLVDGTHSRILEFDPLSGRVFWEYAASPPEAFFSRYCGSVQALANGNVLVTESSAGRAFEITRDTREVVWEFVSPHRAGERNELVAALFEVLRLAPGFAETWLGSAAASSGT